MFLLNAFCETWLERRPVVHGHFGIFTFTMPPLPALKLNSQSLLYFYPPPITFHTSMHLIPPKRHQPISQRTPYHMHSTLARSPSFTFQTLFLSLFPSCLTMNFIFLTPTHGEPSASSCSAESKDATAPGTLSLHQNQLLYPLVSF